MARHLLPWTLVCLAVLGVHNVATLRTYGNNNTRAMLYNTQRNIHANISALLDNLLHGYDNSVRPDFGGPPAVVEVDIMVRSMGPISEVDMTYSMDCYFRQSWVDRRLAFKGAQDTLALSISMLARIWKPDTYFYNGKQSYLHTITTPNKFVRLHQDGRVLYSSRLTIKAGCPMRLENFPMDTQKCPLKFGSFGYSTRDVVYRWNPSRQVAIAEDMKLSQFDLVDCPAGNTTDRVVHQLSGPTPSQQPKKVQPKTVIAEYEYSMLIVSFHLQRHMGNFLIQVYGPCILLVVLSWVSFWLNREATADRVSLGITTVLTMTFLGLEARTDLPKVPYPTALDFFVFLSFAFIFATILQFAFVHYFTKYGSGECYFTTEEIYSGSDSDDDGEEEEEAEEEEKEGNGVEGGISPFAEVSRNGNGKSGGVNIDAQLYEVIPLSVCSITSSSPVMKPPTFSIWNCFCINSQPSDSAKVLPMRDGPSGSSSEGNRPRKSFSTLRGNRNGNTNGKRSGNRRRNKRAAPRFNSVSKIDRASRILFPLTFLVINLFYWLSYLYDFSVDQILFHN